MTTQAIALPQVSNRVSWFGQVVAAVILGQTLFFKFTGAPEAQYIFQTLGVEPWGRIGTGVIELLCVVLLLVPRTAAVGAVLALGLMAGAIMSHLLFLGIEVQGDGGTLFILALVTTAAASLVAWVRRRQIPIIGQRFD